MQVLRVRARRRLIGTAVLVAAGVVIFPLIFETQPRPIPVDLPIEIPRKDRLPPLVVPTREPLTQAAAPPASVSPEVPGSITAAVGAAAPLVTATVTAAASAKSTAAELPAASKPVAVKPKAVDKPVPKPAADGARAQALLEGKAVPAASAAAAGPSPGRFIVQVGAFAENKSAQEMRIKVEKLGLKTYAQAVDTADGKRVRVRLGPFGSRDEADRAAARLRAAGLPGAILTL